MVILYQFNWLLYLPLLLEESLSRYLAYFRFALCIPIFQERRIWFSNLRRYLTMHEYLIAVALRLAERSCGLQLHKTRPQTESPFLCSEHRGMSQDLG